MRAIIRLMTVPHEKRDRPWLMDALQAAIQLELSTIPPYLYAYWSIDTNQDPSQLAETIVDIAKEEMRHMAIACNLLASIGGRPDILGAVSKYPATLPKDVHKGLEVGLASFSKPLLLNTFMVIEEPVTQLADDPDFKPTGSLLIGEFYSSVMAEFEKQVTNPLPDDKQLSAFSDDDIVHNLDDVRRCIGLIKRQGEGSEASPFEVGTMPAHFYQFGEIYHENSLKQIQDNPPRFAYTGDKLTFPKAFAVTVATEDESREFNRQYSEMLRKLQQAWELGRIDGQPLLDEAMHSDMINLSIEAGNLVGQRKGPSFLFIEPAEDSIPLATPRFIAYAAKKSTFPQSAALGRYSQVLEILDRAVGAGSFGAHGPFWRDKTRDQFVQLSVFAKKLLIIGNGKDSNLILALRGQAPFGRDTGTAGASLRRMPAGLPPVADVDIDFISGWIDDGCPDDAPAPAQASVSLTTGAQRPDPQVHIAFWRDFDDWAMYHATPEIRTAIEAVFGFFPMWQVFAEDVTKEKEWTDALAAGSARAAVELLSARQKQTVESHYGVPVPLLTVLDSFERFGNDGLPDDPLRPQAPRHNMNGEIMWFVWSAFAEACVRLGVSTDFWKFYMRALLCGMLNDGVFRKRFMVQGFSAVDEDHLRIVQYCQEVSDADLPKELRRRYADSGL